MVDLARDIIGTQPILAIFLAIGIGYLVGQINLGGFSLGVGAVLFVGLAIGAFAPKANIAGPIGLTGLVMFLYGIGILYGRQFFEGMVGAEGRKYNFLALLAVVASHLQCPDARPHLGATERPQQGVDVRDLAARLAALGARDRCGDLGQRQLVCHTPRQAHAGCVPSWRHRLPRPRHRRRVGLAAAVVHPTNDYLQRALETVRTKHVVFWARQHLGPSLQALRQQTLGRLATEQKRDKLLALPSPNS